MATARRVVEADRYVRAGKWRQWEFMRLLGSDVHAKTLGVIGFGRIGRAVARRALGFDMRVLYCDTVRADAATEAELRATFVDKAELLRESDFVSLHSVLTPETRHLIDAEALRAMKPSAYLINAARRLLEPRHPAFEPCEVARRGRRRPEPCPLVAGGHLRERRRASGRGGAGAGQELPGGLARPETEAASSEHPEGPRVESGQAGLGAGRGGR